MGGKNRVDMTDINERKYWAGLETFQLYQGMVLQHGNIPPRNLENLSYEEGFDWNDSIKIMADFEEDFQRMVASLRADKIVGMEFRSKTNREAAFAYIAKSTFLVHWKKCGFPVHKSFGEIKDSRHTKVDPDSLQELAAAMSAKDDYYDTFLRNAAKEFGCSESRVRQVFPALKYKSLK